MQEFCTHCPVCQLSHPQNTRPPLHPIIEKDCLDRVQVDFIDMRYSPDNEYNCIGHFMNHFSKISCPFSIEKEDSKRSVLYMLQERVLAYLGPPKMFHSDNGG